MKRKDYYSHLIGSRFGKIVVIERDKNMSKEKNRQIFKCICDCGKIVFMRADDLNRNRVKSCGCFKPIRHKDMSGKRKGRLNVIEHAYNLKERAYWMCECDCGRIVIVSQSHLHSGHTLSCGCIRSENEVVYSVIRHFRNIIKPYTVKVLEDSGFQCYLTGRSDELEVHHTTSFKTLYLKTLSELDIPEKESILDYESEEIKRMDDFFIDLHSPEKSLIVLNKDTHTEFHKTYGYQNNTLEEFDDFSSNYPFD